MAILSLFVFVAMLLMAGLAIDMMRHETTRVQMQNTADRAVLAATMMRENNSDATPQQIVEAYFAAEGLSAQLGGRVQVTEDDETGRVVTVVPAASVPTTFMRMLGVNNFDMVTPARAHEAVGAAAQIEIVLVLDISGSMNGQGKIGAMRNAANELAQMMLADDPGANVAITLVPYDAWVLPPAGFLNSFTNVTGSGACNDWTNWTDTEFSINIAMQRRGCNTSAWATVLPYQNDLTTVQTAINGLRARGTTSIDLGVRFGALFFDPTISPAIDALITAGTVPADFSGRPYDWETDNVVRAMIMLTDGQNCCGARYPTSTQDSNTEAICADLRENGVLIYSIAFQAPTSGANLMRNCASSPSHFFNADVSEIVAAFQAIGANIQTQALRLTL